MAYQQPWLHDLTVTLAAPTAVLSSADGQIRDGDGGVQGVLHSDVRVLCRAELRVDGAEPVNLTGALDGANAARFTGLVRSLGDTGADPTVRVVRSRRVSSGLLEEEIRIVSYASVPVETEAVVALGADSSVVERVKQGMPPEPVAVAIDGAVGGAEALLRWGIDGVSVTVHADGGEGVRAVPAGHGAAELRWPVRLPPRGSCVLRWELRARVDGAPVVGAWAEDWSGVEIACDDRRLQPFARQATADLRALLMAPAGDPDAVFAAAGAPWFFTLFGRDSLWTARLMLPFGWRLAAGTLRALAAYQGTKTDPGSMEAPGKIPHELRREASEHGGQTRQGRPMTLPALYYGTVDATPLWVCLLHDAWRAGMPEDQVKALLPNLRAALTWVVEFGDEDGDGFLEYLDHSGRGLSNQGWKDSGDSIRYRDGSLAQGPVALCEAQGYAHEAAVSGAALYEAFGLEGAAELRAWAARLAQRFRERFWVEDADGRYPALALDGSKQPVDSLTSNIGHLLGTGLLDEQESALVVDRLTGPGLDSGYGLRTMDRREGGYSPLSYHCGSVWPHDTAIVISAMSRAGFAQRATHLVDGLLAAAARFEARLPELYSGDGPEQGGVAPYPASCRPQAWAAAAVGAITQCLLGLHTDLPSGRVLVDPVADRRFGALRVTGIVAGGDEFGVEVAADGAARLLDAPASVRLAVEG
jgi:hypothetical protein